MFFRQFYDIPLAQASYLIGCQETGEALVVDPSRDVEPYLEVAASEGLRITRVTETHIHADFVSGARELTARTGAQALLSAEGGSDWQYEYAAADGAELLRDGDVFMIGNLRFDVMHTPGHTPEHLSFLVTDTPAGAGAMGVITGDFVFVGDVGRPDLLERAAHYEGTMRASAALLYKSLQRFKSLPDHLQIWPGHGAGSACGKALGAVPFSTIGYERLANWAFAVDNEATFVEQVLEGQPEPPRYFANMKRINKAGPPVLHGFPQPPRLDASAITPLMRSNAMVVDTRPATAFAGAHVPGTLSIPYNRSFSTWMGWLVPYDVDITLIVEVGADGATPVALSQAVRDLSLIGLDRVTGWLDQAALTAWTRGGGTLEQIPQITVEQLSARGAGLGAQVVDVRGQTEWESGHIHAARNIPVGYLEEQRAALSSSPIVLQCQTGGRSSIAASVLMRSGRRDVLNLVGGIAAWEQAGLPVDQGK